MRASHRPLYVEPGVVSEALQFAADRRDQLTSLKAEGRAAAGAEALCNGALRHAIRVCVERARAAEGSMPRPISRRQMDKLVRLISRRRFEWPPPR